MDEVKSSFLIFHLVLFDKIIKSKTPFVHRVLQKLNFFLLKIKFFCMFWISQVMRLKSSRLHDFSHEYK